MESNGPDYPWNPGATPQLPDPFTVERMVPLMDEAGVDRVVIVPPALNDVNSLCAGSRQALSRPLRGHGPRPAAGSEIRRAAAGVEGSVGMLGVRVTFNTS